jgi:hypothetical protein
MEDLKMHLENEGWAVCPVKPSFKLTQLKAAQIFHFFLGGGESATPCSFPPSRPSIFSDYSFLVHHPVSRDDQCSNRKLRSHSRTLPPFNLLSHEPVLTGFEPRFLFHPLANEIVQRARSLCVLLPINPN